MSKSKKKKETKSGYRRSDCVLGVISGDYFSADSRLLAVRRRICHCLRAEEAD